MLQIVMIRKVDFDVFVSYSSSLMRPTLMNYGLPLPQVKVSDISQPMKLHCPLVQGSPMPYSSYMHSADVTQFHSLLVIKRRQHGKFGRYNMMKSLQHFFTLASNPDLKSISDQLEVLECFVVLMYD